MNKEVESILDIFENKIPSLFGPNKDIRQSQIQMSLDIAEFLYDSSKNILFLEAPVGTGKSLGNLVPTILYSKNQKKRITYATSTINLQNQIFEHDSVLLERIGLIKENEKIFALGKSNYICKAVYFENRKQFLGKEKEQLEDYFKKSKHGQVSELKKMYPDFDKKKIKKYLLMSKSKRECSIKCPGHDHRSNYMNNRNILTVTNHDQQIQTYLNSKKNRRPLLPTNPGIIIFDEAHALKENFLGRLEESISYKKINGLNVKVKRKEYEKLMKEMKNLKNKNVLSGSASGMRHKTSKGDIDLIKNIKGVLESNLIQESLQNSPYNVNEKSSLEEIYNQLSNFLNADKYTSWLQFDSNIELHYVSNQFDMNFKKLIADISKSNKIIFMSGTLTSNIPRKEFEVNWGLDEDMYNYKKYDNIFDLREQAIIYIPEKIAHPSKFPDQHLSELISSLPKILGMSSGGSLVLCTSNDYVDKLSKSIRSFSPENIPIYAQGESDVSMLSEKFKRNESSILVGSGSFFSGFSVEGRALDKVILTKLPYPVPTDPYIELISSGYNKKEVFELFIKPMMFKKLEQGLGRLIRSKKDYGILSIFDSRIWNDEKILKFLEDHNYCITSNIDKAKEFLDRRHCLDGETIFPEYNRSCLKIPSFTVSELVLTSKKEVVNTVLKSESINMELHIEWLKKFVKENKSKNKLPNYVIRYKNLKNSKEVYQSAVNFCYKKNLPFTLINETFLFSSDAQKKNYKRIMPTVGGPVTVTKLD